jgi:hypothetical protein
MRQFAGLQLAGCELIVVQHEVAAGLYKFLLLSSVLSLKFAGNLQERGMVVEVDS